MDGNVQNTRGICSVSIPFPNYLFIRHYVAYLDLYFLRYTCHTHTNTCIAFHHNREIYTTPITHGYTSQPNTFFTLSGKIYVNLTILRDKNIKNHINPVTPTSFLINLINLYIIYSATPINKYIHKQFTSLLLSLPQPLSLRMGQINFLIISVSSLLLSGRQHHSSLINTETSALLLHNFYSTWIKVS